MTRGILICFSGIDGSGKSTIARMVKLSIEKKGIDCSYVYGRVIPFLSRIVVRAGQLLLNKQKRDINNYLSYAEKKKRSLKNPLFSKIYKWSFIIDQVIQTNLRITPLLLNKSIICDRYFIDTIVTDIAIDLGYSKNETYNLYNKLQFFLPKPRLQFLIDLPEKVAFSRKNDVPHMNYLSERRALYNDLTRSLNFIVLDGSRPINDVFNEAINIIDKYLPITNAN